MISLRARLILLVLIPSVPLFAITVHIVGDLRDAQVRGARLQLQTLSLVAAAELRSTVEGGELLLSSVGAVADLARAAPQACKRLFTASLGHSQRYGVIFVTDAQGNARCHSASAAEDLNYADRSYFKQARDTGRFYAGDPVIGRVTGKPLFSLAYPFKDAAGGFGGILYGGLDLKAFGDRFAASQKPSGMTFAIWAEDGTILYRNPDPERWIGKRVEDAGITRAVLARNEESILAQAVGISGVPMLYAITGTEKWSGSRMALSVGLPISAIVSEADAAFRRSLALFAAVFSIALLAAILMGEFAIRRKAVAMAVAAKRISEGDFAARSGVRGAADEMGRLASSFDRMAASLERSTRTLRMLSDANQSLVRAADEPALLADLCRIVVEHGGYQAAWVGYLEHDEAKTVRPVAQHGLTAESLRARRLTWDDAEGGRGPVGQAIRSGAPVVVRDIDADPGDDSSRSFARQHGFGSYASFPVRTRGGTVGVLGIAARERGRFDEGDTALLAELASDLGFGVEALRNRLALDRQAAQLAGLVRRRTQELEDANRFLDSIIENIPAMIFVKDAQALRFVRLNRAGEELLGFPRAEMMGKGDMDFFPAAEADRFMAADREVLAAGRMVQIEEEPVHTRHRGVRFLATKKIPILDESGTPKYLLGISEDITERKAREQEILALNATLAQNGVQLEAANRELEAFSYSVSHDLRAPLRHVQGYVEMLAMATKDQLPDKARRYLGIINDAAMEMGQLIDDLLAFSRTARTEMNKSWVDMDALVAESIRMLEMATKDRDIQWRIQPLPRAYGDAALVRQVWANLVGNAIKYSRTRSPAVIEVGVLQEGSAPPVFFVRDNGVGFDMQHTRKLFGVFQRLHRAEEFEGTGIGLATVQRIVLRHGGRIWADAAPGRGATFFFTLAKDETGEQAKGNNA